MQFIHTHFKKQKVKKPSAKQRELRANWEKLLKKYETKPTPSKATSKKQIAGNPTHRVIRAGSDTSHIPSLNSGLGVAIKKENQKYTGTAMKGIGTMHKSNSIPIFSNEEAIAIATMRR